MSDLLPCPFCGGEAELRHAIFCGYDSQWVECTNRKKCGAKVEPVTDVPGVAIAAWNTRAERTCHDVKPSLPFFKCDSCGMEDMGGTELWIQDGFYRSQKPNYCPNCGAKVVTE